MKEKQLEQIHKNQTVQVIGIQSGSKINKRISEIGLHRGAIIEVVKNDLGPLIIRFENTKLALGRGICEKIIVREV